MNAQTAAPARYKKLIWADVRDLSRPLDVSIRGVRFFECVELQLGTAFLLQGVKSIGEYPDHLPSWFVAGGFEHAISKCRGWALKDPKLFLYVSPDAGLTAPVFARITEVHGQSVYGPLILKLETGESMIIDADAGPIPSGPLKRLFPPPEAPARVR